MNSEMKMMFNTIIEEMVNMKNEQISVLIK